MFLSRVPSGVVQRLVGVSIAPGATLLIVIPGVPAQLGCASSFSHRPCWHSKSKVRKGSSSCTELMLISFQAAGSPLSAARSLVSRKYAFQVDVNHTVIICFRHLQKHFLNASVIHQDVYLAEVLDASAIIRRTSVTTPKSALTTFTSSGLHFAWVSRPFRMTAIVNHNIRAFLGEAYSNCLFLGCFLSPRLPYLQASSEFSLWNSVAILNSNT